MSPRSIAPVVGASQRTVADDLSRTAHLTPTVEPDDDVVEAELVEMADASARSSRGCCVTLSRDLIPDRARTEWCNYRPGGAHSLSNLRNSSAMSLGMRSWKTSRSSTTK